jgi:hypothetical protein
MSQCREPQASGRGPEDVAARLEAATEALRRERRRIEDELEALEAFERRVRGIEPRQPAAGGRQAGGVAVSISRAAAGADALGAVRDAYESTVMSVPHYDEDYGDTYAESLNEEFGPDVAVRLVDGSSFDERSKQGLLSAVETAATAREQFRATLDTETGSLEAARDLVEIAGEVAELEETTFARKSFGTLDANRAYLSTLEERCENRLRRRQAAVFQQRRDVTLPRDAPDIAQYLYHELPDTYPVMAVVADLLATIDRLRSNVERAMTFCHG